MSNTPAKSGPAQRGAPPSRGSPAAATARPDDLTGPLLPKWQALMRRGMNADRGRAPAKAQALYLLARDIARVLLLQGSADPMSADDRVAAFVVTHLNLADAFADAGQPDVAATHLCAAHRDLIALLLDEGAAPELRQAACHHARETHAALVLHLSEHGEHPEIMAALRTGCLPLAQREAPTH